MVVILVILMMMMMMTMVIVIKTGRKILTLDEGVTDMNWWDGAVIGKMQGSKRRRITPVDNSKDIYFPSIVKIFVRHSLSVWQRGWPRTVVSEGGG